MKIPIFFLILSFVASEGFSQVNKSDQAFTNVYHFGNNISVKNFDGTHSNIYVSRCSATLINANGAQSTIDFFGKNSSTLFAIDGTTSTISHNGLSSSVFNSDGTRIIVNHMQSNSSCSIANKKHSISHTFSKMKERRFKDEIDVLIHRNWMIQMMAAQATDELDRKENQD